MNPQIVIRDKRNGSWYYIHRVVLEDYAEKIGPIGIALYNALCSFVNSKISNERAWPSMETLAKLSGIGRTTALKHIHSLEKVKLIRIVSRRQYSLEYHILKVHCSCGQPVVHQMNISSSDVHDVPSDVHMLPSDVHHMNTNKKNEQDKRTRTGTGKNETTNDSVDNSPYTGPISYATGRGGTCKWGHHHGPREECAHGYLQSLSEKADAL